MHTPIPVDHGDLFCLRCSRIQIVGVPKTLVNGVPNFIALHHFAVTKEIGREGKSTGKELMFMLAAGDTLGRYFPQYYVRLMCLLHF